MAVRNAAYIISIAFFLILFSTDTSAQNFTKTESWLCKNCVDSASAKEQATAYAPSLDCKATSPINGPEKKIQCKSSPRRIILGNPDTKQVFAFIVNREKQKPWGATVLKTTLPPEMMDNANNALLFLEDWTEAIHDTNRAVNSGMTRADIMAAKYGGTEKE